MIPPNRSARKRPAPRMYHLHPPSVGDFVEVWWDGEDTYFRGKLVNQNHSPMSFLIAYDDGDQQFHDLDQELWRYVEDTTPEWLPPHSDNPVNITCAVTVTPKPSPRNQPAFPPFQKPVLPVSEATKGSLSSARLTHPSPLLPIKEQWKQMYRKLLLAQKNKNHLPKELHVAEDHRKEERKSPVDHHMKNALNVPLLAISGESNPLEYIPTTFGNQAGRFSKKRKVNLKSPTSLQDVDYFPDEREFSIL